MVTVRVEVVTECEHGYAFQHVLWEYANMPRSNLANEGRCPGGSGRYTLTGWPPEAIEAMAFQICAADEHPLNPVPAGFKGPCVGHLLVARGAAAALWDHITKETQ